MKTIALMLCLFMLSGCAALRDRITAIGEKNKGHVSYVAPEISKADTDELTKDMSQFLMNQFPVAKTTLEFEPMKNPLHVQLVDQLARKGFGIIEKNLKDDSQGIQVRYLVTRLDRGLLVRLQYQGKQASRFYDRTIDGRLSLHTSYTIREARN